MVISLNHQNRHLESRTKRRKEVIEIESEQDDFIMEVENVKYDNEMRRELEDPKSQIAQVGKENIELKNHTPSLKSSEKKSKCLMLMNLCTR
jgi:hypothetical protein